MIESLQSFMEGIPPIWQGALIMLISAVPYIESYFGAAVGVLGGLPLAAAISLAVVGNIVSMLVFVFFGDKIAKRRNQASKRAVKFNEAFVKYGIPGVSLFGQTLLPSQITSSMMVALGAPREKVIFWQIISIILWGVLFGMLARAGELALLD